MFVYPPLGSSTGTVNEAPSVTINGSNTGLIQPFGIALDSSRNIYVTDIGATSVFVYPAPGIARGLFDEFPISTISGGSTDLSFPYGIALDSSGKIYVADEGDESCDGTESVYVYPAGSNGNEAPTATISGGKTDLCYPVGIALDSSSKIFVADAGNPSACPTDFPQRICLCGAGKQHRAAQQGPHRQDKRSTHRAG